MKIIIVKRYDRNFRIPLYQLLKKKLATHDIQLELHYGEPDEIEKKSIKDYIIDDPIGKKVNNIYLKLPGINLCYQPCLSLTAKCDLVIVQQGNRELLNYFILLRRMMFKRPKVAFWGHGKNFQGDPKSIKEKFKSWYSNKVDFWFAYNDLSRKLLIERGFNENKIASLNNTIDTRSQIEYFESITEEEKTNLRNSYQIAPTDPVGIFCASIYQDKQIDFLLEALEIIKAKVPDFKFIMIGKGVEDFKVIAFSKKNPGWFFYPGNKFDREKIKHFSIADFQAIPGAVGLNIIDSFSFLCPLITTSINNHGPEISYLKNDENGIMTNINVEEYATRIVRLISDTDYENKLKQGCRKAREMYSIENMADNFVNGVLKLLTR